MKIEETHPVSGQIHLLSAINISKALHTVRSQRAVEETPSKAERDGGDAGIPADGPSPLLTVLQLQLQAQHGQARASVPSTWPL